MIVNRTLTHPGISSFYHWQPESDLLNAFLVSALTTLLTYQLMAIVFDLSTGWKRRGEAEISSIASVFLSEQASPISVLAALFPGRGIAAWQHHGIGKKCPQEQYHPRSNAKFHAGTLVKFLFLLSVAPVLGLVGVVINLEQDKKVTFAQARFGGVSLGLDPEIDVELRDGKLDCFMHNMKWAKYEEPIAEVFQCAIITVDDKPHRFADDEVTAEFILSRNVEGVSVPAGAITALFRSPGEYYLTYIYMDVFTEGQSYRVKPNVSLADGKGVVLNFINTFRRDCAEGIALELTVSDQLGGVGREDERWTVRQQLKNCETGESLEDAQRTLMASFTAVEAEKLEVLEVGSADRYVDGRGLVLLRRREAVLNVAPLFIISGCVLLLRAFVRVVTNNDVNRGIELILKHNFGMKSCDSMLQSRRSVRFEDVVMPVEKIGYSN